MSLVLQQPDARCASCKRDLELRTRMCPVHACQQAGRGAHQGGDLEAARKLLRNTGEAPAAPRLRLRLRLSRCCSCCACPVQPPPDTATHSALQGKRRP